MGEFWTRKYAPESTAGIRGQVAGISQLKRFVAQFKQQKKKGCLVYGPPGCGKSAAVCALAKELGLELVELNASDFRNADAINSIVGSASKQGSLFNKGKIILVDEIDGLAGREDRGGLQAIVKLLDESSFPIILTANNPFESRFSKLRKVCAMVQFQRLQYSVVAEVLSDICKVEGIANEQEALEGLARRVDGDLRGAIIDLFILTRLDRRLGKRELELLNDRQREMSILDALTRILKTKEIEIALSALNDVGEDMDEVLMWLDENMPKEYQKAEDLARGYEALSRAAVFKGRIRRRQHWRFLVYVNALLTVGVALAKKERYRGLAEYKRSKRPLSIWIYNRRNLLRNSIAEKLARATHTSTKRAFHDVPFLKPILKAEPGLSEELGLDDKEAEWLLS